jgi:hypothetical protein
MSGAFHAPFALNDEAVRSQKPGGFVKSILPRRAAVFVRK